MAHKVFLHGVPDSPSIWGPLIDALGLTQGEYTTPALPGFLEPQPAGFGGTKDDYANWLIGILEKTVQIHGPVDLVGHDWGALLTLRVASLRPDLIRTWAVSNAVFDEDYPGHKVARIWNRPILGELFMLISTSATMGKALAEAGIPEPIAQEEARNWKNWHMRRSILGLYRSANGLRFTGDWVARLADLPEQGMLLWGEDDPYMPPEVARRFATKQNVPLDVIGNAGHWAIAQQPEKCAQALTKFWS